MNEMLRFRKKKSEERPEITGQSYENANLPGTDSYDDGLDIGVLKQPGSTSTESGGTYMEHKGPNDLVHHAGVSAEALMELDPEVRVTNEPEADVNAETKGDAADEWLKKHDPRYGL
jgi:hypothetical protein